MQTFKVFSFDGGQILFEIDPYNTYIEVKTYFGIVKSEAYMEFGHSSEAHTAFSRIDRKIALRIRGIMDRGDGYTELNQQIEKVKENYQR